MLDYQKNSQIVLFEFQIANQSYLSVTHNTSSTKLGNQTLPSDLILVWLRLALLVFRVTDKSDLSLSSGSSAQLGNQPFVMSQCPDNVLT